MKKTLLITLLTVTSSLSYAAQPLDMNEQKEAAKELKNMYLSINSQKEKDEFLVSILNQLKKSVQPTLPRKIDSTLSWAKFQTNKNSITYTYQYSKETSEQLKTTKIDVNSPEFQNLISNLKSGSCGIPTMQALVELGVKINFEVLTSSGQPAYPTQTIKSCS